MTNNEKQKMVLKDKKRKLKEYERQYGRFGNPIIRMQLYPGQRKILNEAGYTDTDIDNFIHTFYS